MATEPLTLDAISDAGDRGTVGRMGKIALVLLVVALAGATPSGGRTNMVSPSGMHVSVPDDALASAINAGYRVETVEEGLDRATEEGRRKNDQRDPMTYVAGGACLVAVMAIAVALASRRRDQKT